MRPDHRGSIHHHNKGGELRVDWTQFKQTLCDDLRPNALDVMNPYVTINAVMPMVEYQAAEIDRLKAELELRDKVIEQAIDLAVIHSDRIGIFSMARVRDVSNFPELYSHLAGRWE